MHPRISLITLAVRDLAAAAEPQQSPVVLAHNVATPDDVDAVVALVSTAGGSVVVAPQRRESGGYSAYVADPEGYRWEVAYNPTRMGEWSLGGSSG